MNQKVPLDQNYQSLRGGYKVPARGGMRGWNPWSNLANYRMVKASKKEDLYLRTRVKSVWSKFSLVNLEEIMESELVTVRRITLSKADIDEAIKTYIEAYHAHS
jgi:hypothetical protein